MNPRRARLATKCFNSRTREGCDGGWRDNSADQAGFNSRTREGCDVDGTEAPQKPYSFNSRTREGCDWGSRGASRRGRRFNSRTREGCDVGDIGLRESDVVSIHAPGRGATEATQPWELAPRRFQFTHPGGVRQLAVLDRVGRLGVSIHAPGRGATRERWSQPHQAHRFNSRTREGCDVDFLILAVFLYPFQFTHPGGVRRLRRRASGTYCSFQFTHPGGVRLYLPVNLLLQACFNSRTREGCDPTRRSVYSLPPRFQFTHPGGVRLARSIAQGEGYHVSIHAPGRGATESVKYLVDNLQFQFTHPGGVRRNLP